MASTDPAVVVGDVVGKLIDSQHPEWLEIVVAARLDELAEGDPAPQEAVRPYRWLIETVGDGVALTAAGYLRPAMVTEAMIELGWTEQWIGKQNREDQTLPVLSLRESAQRAGLLRKVKGRLLVTKNGKRLAQDPVDLWWHVVRHLPDAEDQGQRQLGVLYLLQVAAGRPEDIPLLAAGWDILGWRRSNGGRLTENDTRYASYEVRGNLQRLGVLPRPEYGVEPRPPGPAAVRAARAALVGREAPAPAAAATVEPAAGVQLKITLSGTQPPIWRRIEVPADYSLVQLDAVIQIAMGWDNSHLHRFEIGGVTYSYQLEEDPWSDQQFGDEFGRTVGEATRRRRKFHYEYDFGDGWRHEIQIEKRTRDQPVSGPRLLDGARACPPEDCGGVWGYANLVEAVGDPKHPEHEDLLDWVGGSFDPAVFDREQVDALLVAYGRAQRLRQRRNRSAD